MDAVKEAIAIGERAKLPVQITHIKLGTLGVWGKAKEVVALVEAAQKRFYERPWVMVASDGGIANNHPRGAGTFPRVLGLYVREQQWMTLQDAVHKMTAMPAARMGLKDRGLLREGMKADLVLFDPATVTDHSTFEQPRALSTGIAKVWVNGGLVWNGTGAGGALTGRVLTR